MIQKLVTWVIRIILEPIVHILEEQQVISKDRHAQIQEQIGQIFNAEVTASMRTLLGDKFGETLKDLNGRNMLLEQKLNTLMVEVSHLRSKVAAIESANVNTAIVAADISTLSSQVQCLSSATRKLSMQSTPIERTFEVNTDEITFNKD